MTAGLIAGEIDVNLCTAQRFAQVRFHDLLCRFGFVVENGYPCQGLYTSGRCWRMNVHSNDRTKHSKDFHEKGLVKVR